MGKTLYTAKIDSKEKIVTVFRESQQQQSMAQVASLVLDGREGMATEKALITLPTAQRGPVDKVFER